MKTVTQPSISVAFAGILTDWLAREGLSAPGLTRPIEAAGPRGRLSMDAWKDLLDQAQGLRQDEPVGLNIGSGIRARKFCLPRSSPADGTS